MEEANARRAAEALFDAHKGGAQFKTLDGLASITDAYDIQDQYVALLRAGQGEAIGYKVGLTSKTMQTFCGIDHPIGGVVLAKREHKSGATVKRGDYGRLGLEFEIAVRMKSDMPASAQTPAVVAPYIDGVCAAIEVVDDRAADYGMCARWSRTIPGMPESCSRSSRRNGQTLKTCTARLPRTARRWAKVSAATFSAIPSTRWPGSTPTSPRAAAACARARSS
jgi:hypothetical protein